MTNNYDFILKNRRWSFSSTSSYNMCPFGFRLTYIDEEERETNVFSDFGLLVHSTLEKYFLDELEIWDLVKYYVEHFDEFLKSVPPAFPANMVEIYYQAGLKYFENFDFDKSLYEVIAVEETIDSTYRGIDLVVKPDLILKEKSTGEYHLIDFKTAKLKNTSKDKKEQLNTYMNQFNLYAYFFEIEKKIHIDKIIIWFIRDGVEIVKNVEPIAIQNTLNWFEKSVNNAINEEEWSAISNGYFCQEICGNRFICPMNTEINNNTQ